MWRGKQREMGKKWFLHDFYSESQVIMLHITYFILCCIKSLESTIAFRYNLPCFWEIVSQVQFGRTQINYFKLFMYACISYNDKKESKARGNLLKITINFWTLCTCCLNYPIAHALSSQVLMHPNHKWEITDAASESLYSYMWDSNPAGTWWHQRPETRGGG